MAITDQEFRVFTNDHQFVGFLPELRIRKMLRERKIRRCDSRRRAPSYVLTAELSECARAILDEPDAILSSAGGRTSLCYSEELNALTGKTTAYLVTLKKPGPNGSFVKWTSKDAFAVRRFNPDRIPSPLLSRHEAN